MGNKDELYLDTSPINSRGRANSWVGLIRCVWFQPSQPSRQYIATVSYLRNVYASFCDYDTGQRVTLINNNEVMVINIMLINISTKAIFICCELNSVNETMLEKKGVRKATIGTQWRRKQNWIGMAVTVSLKTEPPETARVSVGGGGYRYVTGKVKLIRK